LIKKIKSYGDILAMSARIEFLFNKNSNSSRTFGDLDKDIDDIKIRFIERVTNGYFEKFSDFILQTNASAIETMKSTAIAFVILKDLAKYSIAKRLIFNRNKRNESKDFDTRVRQTEIY